MVTSFFFWVGTIYDRLLVLFILFVFSKILENTKAHPISKSAAVMYSIWIYLGACFVYKSNGYFYDWRNRIRLYHKFDLTGLYKGAYHIFSVVLGYCFISLSKIESKRTVDLLNSGFSKSLQKKKLKTSSKNYNKSEVISSDRFEILKIYQIGMCLCFSTVYFLGIFTLTEEDKMFRLKVFENSVITQSFFLALCL